MYTITFSLIQVKIRWQRNNNTYCSRLGNLKLSKMAKKFYELKKVRPCLVGKKFSVFSIQTFRKQGKRV